MFADGSMEAGVAVALHFSIAKAVLSPASVDQILRPGSQSETTIVLRNDGNGPLVYQLGATVAVWEGTVWASLGDDNSSPQSLLPGQSIVIPVLALSSTLPPSRYTQTFSMSSKQTSFEAPSASPQWPVDVRHGRSIELSGTLQVVLGQCFQVR